MEYAPPLGGCYRPTLEEEKLMLAFKITTLVFLSSRDLGKECLCWKEWDIEERPYNVARNWEEQTQGAGREH